MSATIVKYPRVNVATGAVSRWNAVHNPLIYEIQRIDFLVWTSQNSGGFVKLNTITPHYILAGETIYVKTGVYDQLCVATAVTSTTITTDIIFQTASSGGWVNRNQGYTNYRIETKVLGINGTNQYYLIATSINYPNAKGLTKVDLAPYLRGLLKTITDGFDRSQINWKDQALGSRFNLQYREVYDGSPGTFSTVSSADKHYIVNAARQIQSKYGQNLGEYVPFETPLPEEKLAKFLSGFERPTYFVGFPFDLSFIYDAGYSYSLSREEDELDINGSVVNHDSDLLLSSQNTGVNRMLVNPGASPQLDVWLCLQLGLLSPPDAVLEASVLEPSVTVAHVIEEPYNPTG